MAISMNTGDNSKPEAGQVQQMPVDHTAAQEWMQNAAQQQPLDAAPVGYEEGMVQHHSPENTPPWDGDVTDGDILSDAGLDAAPQEQTNQQIANQQAEAGDMLAAMAATQTVAIDPAHPEGDKTVESTPNYDGVGIMVTTNKVVDTQLEATKMETEQKQPVPVELPSASATAAAPLAKVAFKAGFTKNMSDFNSYRCDVMIELPCGVEQVADTYAKSKALVEERLQECYNEAEQMAVSLQQQQQAQIQAQSDPVSIPPHLQGQAPVQQQAVDPQQQQVNVQQPYQQPQYQNQQPVQQQQYQPPQQQQMAPQQPVQQQQFAPQQQQYVDSQTATQPQQQYQPQFLNGQ